MEHNLTEFHTRIHLLKHLNVSVYLKNWIAGFGSALVCLIDNISYFNKFGVTIYPLWVKQTDAFKYTDGKINCFYEFFDDNLYNESIMKDINITIDSNAAVIVGAGLTDTGHDLIPNSLIFKQRFKIKEKYYTLFNNLSQGKNFTFSIHLRSNFQKRLHFMNNGLQIVNIIKKLQAIYGKDCVPYIATDVESYLRVFLDHFPNAVYNADTFRVPEDYLDSSPGIKDSGVRHGEDIILDLIGLSKGKKVYMSESNFYTIMRYMFDEDLEIINLRKF